MTNSKTTADYIRQSLTALNLIEQPITYQDYINNKETTTEAEDDEQDRLTARAEKVDKNKLKAWYDKYSKYESNNYSNLVWGMIKAWTDTGILTDAYEENEWAAVVDKFGQDKADEMEIDEVMKYMPITKAMHDEIEEMFGQGGEDTLETVYQMLTSMGVNFVGEDSEYDQPASQPEAEMVDNQIAFIKYAVDEIEDNVKAGGEFPEWFQNKLSGVHETIKMLHAYMEGERRSDDQGEEQMGEKAPPGREKQVKKLKKKFDDPGAPYAIAWAQHNKHGKPSKESIGESTMTDTNKEKLNEGIRIQTDSLEDSIALMTIMKNAGLDPQQMNIQQSPSMNAPAPDMTPDLPAEIPGEEPKDMPMDEPESEAFDNAPDEKFLDKDDYELKRNKVPNTKMGSASAKQGDNPMETIEEIAKKLNREYELFKEGRQKDEREDMEADASDMSKEEFIKAHGEAKAYIWDRVQAREKGQTNEGRVKDMVLDMESDAAEMSKEEFIKTHGEQYAHIWDRVQGQMSGDPQYDEGHANEDRASDSVVMAKLKQAVGGEEKLVSTLFSSAVQNNMDDDEFIDAASRMLNMPPQEIQAIIDNDMNPQQEEDSELEDILRLSGTGETMEAKKSKPDYLDFDKDGDKKEPMKKALADKKKK